MTGRVAKYVLLDTGFWIGLLDPRDEHHATAQKLYREKLEPMHAIVPWPSLYEFMQTRFMKKEGQVAGLVNAFGRPGIHRLDDSAYRDGALAECLPVFMIPDDIRTIIWRYMDFAKFVDMLERGKLFLARADTLSDRLEGTVTPNNVKARKGQWKEHVQNYEEGVEYNYASRNNKITREWAYISCGHMNQYESAAMWKLYAKSNQAIAVRSTYERLRKSIPEPLNARIGQVRYIDFERDATPENNMYWPLFIKRKSFEHEAELRVVSLDTEGVIGEFGSRSAKPKPEFGIYMDVDLELLVESVYVAPTAPAWFSELVQRVAAKYLLKAPVKSSALDAGPLF